MISVLYLVDNLGPGGSQRYVAELARTANFFKVSPHVCSFREGGVFHNELLEKKVPLLFTPFCKLYGIDGIKALFSIIRYIKFHKINVIHAFQTNANILGTLAARLSGIRVITTRRDMGDFGMRGSPRLSKFETLVINRLVDKIVANSIAAKLSAEENEQIPKEKIGLIYNGIDCSRFQVNENKTFWRKNLGIIKDYDCVFGIVAGHRPVKSVNTAIRAFKIVNDRLPRTLLLLVGDGPERQALEHLVKDLELEGSVLFLGNRQDVENILPAFDVFLNSSYSESFSNAILEAMATGLPVIATNVGGNPESVEDGVSGFLVEPNNPMAMGLTMEKLAIQIDERRKMGQAGRMRVETLFSKEKSFEKLEELYQSLFLA